MAIIKFIREYDFYGTKYCDIAYARNDGKHFECTRVRTYPADEMPKTAKKWLENRKGIMQYNGVFDRDEIIYKEETVYRVEFDFTVNGRDIHDYLNNNGKGFTHEDAVSVARQLAEQGNRNVMVIAM